MCRWVNGPPPGTDAHDPLLLNRPERGPHGRPHTLAQLAIGLPCDPPSGLVPEG